MAPEKAMQNFLKEAFDCTIKKLKSASLSVVFDYSNKDKDFNFVNNKSDCIAKCCKNILLNNIIQTGGEIDLSTSKLAQSYRIAKIMISNCTSYNGSDFGVVAETTDVFIESVLSKDFCVLKKALHNDKIHLAGVSSEADKVKQIMRFCLFKQAPLGHQIGILLHGPSGCGKTSFVKFVALECDAIVLTIQRTDILQSEFGSGSETLKRMFKKAIALSEESPVFLFLDEIDTLCPCDANASQGSKQIMYALMHELDNLHERCIPGLLVIAATNAISEVNLSLRRPGRFAHEILINIPSKAQRLAILELYTASMDIHKDVQLFNIALKTPGYVGADIRSLCEEADSHAMKRNNSSLMQKYTVTIADFDHGLHLVSPLSKRISECVVDLQMVRWEDIGGLEDVKNEIKQSVEWPLLYPDVLSRMDLTSTKGVLLYGPPGCCKTTLVKAAATSCHVTFLSLSGAQVFSPYVGQSERIISEAFQKARALSPAILFFDEIETLVGKRSSERNHSRVQERILATLLNEMDGVGVRLDKKMNACLKKGQEKPMTEKERICEQQNVKDNELSMEGTTTPTEEFKDTQVMVIGATNRPDMLDPAIMRPGRLDKHIYVPPPDSKAREAILKVYTSKMSTSDLDLHKMSLETENYTGADLKNLCKEAGLFALREMLTRHGDSSSAYINSRHFELAKDVVKPSL